MADPIARRVVFTKSTRATSLAAIAMVKTIGRPHRQILDPPLSMRRPVVRTENAG